MEAGGEDEFDPDVDEYIQQCRQGKSNDKKKFNDRLVAEEDDSVGSPLPNSQTTDFSSWKVDELRGHLREIGIQTSGNKWQMNWVSKWYTLSLTDTLKKTAMQKLQ